MSKRWLALPMTCDESLHVMGAQAKPVDDTEVREHAAGRPLVDRCTADAEELCDLANGEELFDRR
jgi:hypothetical protein